MKDLRWTTRSSDYLFKDTWLTIRRDNCERADGKIITPYYVYEFSDWVNTLALTEDGRVVLVRQYRHALDITAWELPGGCVDQADGGHEKAAARELLEETGYTFDKWEYLGKTSANPSTNNNWMHMYLATGGRLTAGQDLDEHEEIEVQLFTIAELKELLDQQAIVQSMHVTAIIYAFKRLGISY